jgi:Fur family ferric uptake transcriptional regulator
MTLTRQVIIEALDNADGFLSAEELYMLVRDEYPGIGVATVYRTLQLLEDLAMVHRIETGEGRARYAMNRELPENGGVPGHEVLLVCDRCGEIIRQPGADAKILPLFEELSRDAEKEHHFRTGRRTLQIHGICAACYGAAGAEKGE